MCAYFIRFILLHIRISNASSPFCSFPCSVHVSAPYNATLHTKHFTSLFLISVSLGWQKMLVLLLKATFAIAIQLRKNPGEKTDLETDPIGNRVRDRCGRGNDVALRPERWSNSKISQHVAIV